jgi:iron(III) transport system permease protein
MAQKTKLRNWRPFFITLVVIVQFIIAIVPLVVLTYSTFMLKTGDYSLGNFSLAHWIGQSDLKINNGEPGVLLNKRIYLGAWNSIRLSLWTSFLGGVIGVILGYAIVKGRGTRLSKIVEQLAFIPYVIPGIAFGAVYISMFTKSVWGLPPLYGTFALLVVVSVAKHIPHSSRTGVSAMMQVARNWRRQLPLLALPPGNVSSALYSL